MLRERDFSTLTQRILWNKEKRPNISGISLNSYCFNKRSSHFLEKTFTLGVIISKRKNILLKYKCEALNTYSSKFYLFIYSFFDHLVKYFMIEIVAFIC